MDLMDLGAGMNPGAMLSGVAISVMGLAIFLYGKKTTTLPSLAVGLLMMVYPMFVSSVVVMWVIACGCVGGLFVASRAG